MSKRFIQGIVVTLVVGSLLAVTVAQLNRSAVAQSGVEVLAFEVAENGLAFTFDEAPVFEDGFPAHGNPFVTQGYIYPAGTLSDSHGVLPDGSPEFPELVLGTWYCYGIHVNDGAHTESGVWVVATEVYEFGDVAGAETVITDGVEIADLDVLLTRPITGGTGRFLGARGEVQKRTLRFDPVMGVNFEVELKLVN